METFWKIHRSTREFIKNIIIPQLRTINGNYSDISFYKEDM